MRSLMRLRTRALIQEKTSAGFAAVRTRGRIDAAEARHIQQMIQAGTPKSEIAAVLGIGRATLYRHLAISNG
ncbi:helix-turn-helix domain-containing protein [Rhodococcus erythropolis]|nr:helix-turn-helix domain-containing protein [Rhodococcus erythropolis]